MSKKSFLIIAAVIFFYTAIFGLSADEVDRQELEMNMEEVDFINYMGSHEFINTRQEIISIGQSLAGSIKAGSFQSGIAGKYRILHLVDESEKGMLGADILIIEADARVDHIRNIRLILSGYLEQVYSYTAQDAYLIAEFATYYNAVHRGNLDFFSERYINMVLTNINRENAGIDVHYSSWPGKTRLLVPLKAAAGTAGKPDPFEIAGDDVVEDLRKTDDMGIEPRKQIVELQDKTIEEDREKLAEKEKEAADLEKSVEAEKAEIEEKKEALAMAEADGADAEELEKAAQEIAEKEAAAAEKEKEIEEKQRAIDEEKDDLAKKEETVAGERERIAEDSNLLLEKAAAEDEEGAVTAGIREPDKAVFLKMEKKDVIYTGRLGLFITQSGEPVAESSVKTTGARLYLETEDGIIIPAEESSDNFHLNLIDKQKLEPLAKSAEAVYAETFILYNDKNIYCIIKQDQVWKVARYSEDLKLLGVSAVDAYPHTFIKRADSRVLFQAADGEVVSVDYNTLER